MYKMSGMFMCTYLCVDILHPESIHYAHKDDSNWHPEISQGSPCLVKHSSIEIYMYTMLLWHLLYEPESVSLLVYAVSRRKTYTKKT